MSVLAGLSRPSTSTTPHRFYGWRIVGYASLALAATGPGQTVGVSLFVDPLIADLGLSRSAVSTAYLVGTLVGALALPWIGRALDRYGIRRTMAVIGAVFGAVLIALSHRLGHRRPDRRLRRPPLGRSGRAGPGGHHRGRAVVRPPARHGHRHRRRCRCCRDLPDPAARRQRHRRPRLAHRLAPRGAGRVGGRHPGRAVGHAGPPQRPRPVAGRQDPPSPPGRGRPRLGGRPRHRVTAPLLLLVTTGIAVTGLLGTAVAFHQISLLTARGLSTAAAAANFVPQTVATLLATLATGVLADRLRPRWLVVVSMTALALGLAWGTWVVPGLSAFTFGALIGAAGGSIRALEAATFPRYFGTRNLGAIRGLVTAISVGSTAFGPLLFATAHDLTGSYAAVLLATAPIPLAVGLAACVITPPVACGRHGDGSGGGPVNRPEETSSVRPP